MGDLVVELHGQRLGVLRGDWRRPLECRSMTLSVCSASSGTTWQERSRSGIRRCPANPGPLGMSPWGKATWLAC